MVRQTMCQWGRRTWRAADVSCSLMSPCTLSWCSAYSRLLINSCCILSKSLLSSLSKSGVRGQIFETLHLAHENNRTQRREFSRCHRFVGAKCSTSPVGLGLWDIWTGNHEIGYNAVLQYFLNPEQGFSTSHLPTKPHLAPKIVVRSIVAGMSSQEKRGGEGNKEHKRHVHFFIHLFSGCLLNIQHCTWCLVEEHWIRSVEFREKSWFIA